MVTEQERKQIEAEVREEVKAEQRAIKQEWREQHREHIRQYNREYYRKTHPGAIRPHRIKVAMVDEGGKPLRVFSSIREASKSTGISIYRISKCCKRKAKTGSFMWRYYE